LTQRTNGEKHWFHASWTLTDWIKSTPLTGPSVKTILPIDWNAATMTHGATEVTAYGIAVYTEKFRGYRTGCEHC
jgi:hypothetical protein